MKLHSYVAWVHTKLFCVGINFVPSASRSADNYVIFFNFFGKKSTQLSADQPAEGTKLIPTQKSFVCTKGT